VPNPPAFLTPFNSKSWALDTGLPRAQVDVRYELPTNNTDGTPFVDGSHLELRWRLADPLLWNDAKASTWATAKTWGSPVDDPTPEPSEGWEYKFVPLDTDGTILPDLLPGTRYEFQARVLDVATPPNASVWTPTWTQFTAFDDQPPATPAAPEVHGSKIQIVVLHKLGSDQGGIFNLAYDLAYLDVHASIESPDFLPDLSVASTTRLGKITATRAQLMGKIPVLGAFPVTTIEQLHVKVIAVDTSGNISGASASSPVTADLIDAQWIGSLFAERIVSGEVRASLILGGEIATGTEGQRMRMYYGGLQAYLDDGRTKFFDLDTANQTITAVGTFRTGLTGERLWIERDGSARWYGAQGTDYAALLNEDGILRAKSRAHTSGRRSVVDFNPNGVKAWYGMPGAERSKLDLGMTYGVITAPVTGVRLWRHIAPDDGTTPRWHFVTATASGDDAESIVHMERVALASNHCYMFGATANAGIVFDAGFIGVCDNGIRPSSIHASEFAVVSAIQHKRDIAPVQFGDVGADQLVQLVRAQQFYYRSEFEQRPDRPGVKLQRYDKDGRRLPDVDADWTHKQRKPRMRVGPMADHLLEVAPQVVLTDVPRHGMALDVATTAGIAWAAAGVLADRQDAAEARLAALEALLGDPEPVVVDGELVDRPALAA
jgi:hypothetical protein